MTKQFTPADREVVLEKIKDLDFIHEAVPCGPGVHAIHKSGSDDPRTFTNFVEKYGWYCAGFDLNEGGDRVIVMPIERVPE